ncbi:unnamed protein product, partial [Laminaria digitata]
KITIHDILACLEIRLVKALQAPRGTQSTLHQSGMTYSVSFADSDLNHCTADSERLPRENARHGLQGARWSRHETSRRMEEGQREEERCQRDEESRERRQKRRKRWQ